MIKIDYINGTVEDFTVVLSNRNLDKQGQILNVQEFRYKGNLATAQEISFFIYKYVDGIKEKLWDNINNLKIVWVKELNMFFETRISIAESTNTVKKITGISLGEAELSQIQIRNTEINSEVDIARPDYVITTFYNPDNSEASLLNRIISFAPHYKIKYVDKSLWNIQRTFSIDRTSIYDFLTGECAEQIGCLFQFNSTDRSISVYDLYTVCGDCGYRGEYLDYCPECNGTNLYSYGEDTTIFVSVDNLTDEITFDTNVDAIKNCFYLKTGDEIMDAAVIACNPNGSAYIHYFSEEQKANMPTELRECLADYDALVKSHSEEYQTLSEELYDCIDKILYYQSGMMPTVEISDVNATTEVAKLTTKNLSPVGLSMVNTYTSTATVNSALKNFAKVFVKSGFVKIEIETGKFTYIGVDDNGFGYGNWVGSFKVTNYSDEEDVVYSDTLTIRVTADYETFLNQKVLKNIASNNTDDNSIYDVLNIDNLDKFKEALTLYSYNRLESFADAIQGVINVLIEENQGQSDSTYYGQMYTPYYEKLQACQAEMNVRAVTIQEYEDKQTDIIKQQTEIQEDLNMRTFLGEDLYLLFCTYRREDTYQNENFISDGLTNAEIFVKAKEFIDLAKREIVKSGEHQHSITSNLYNLLVMKEFEPIKDKFELGNWIRCKVDDSVYRLRLISYEIDGNSLANINTEFSELTKTASGVNDVRSILSKAQSMATSFQYVSKQAEQGKNAQNTIVNALEEGLNSAHMNIMNSLEQEVILDKNGILCRTKDETGEYSPEQLRITNSILAYTSTGWKDVSLGLGKHDYYYYDNNNALIKSTGYGLSSKFVTSGYIWGSQIIGGEVYSQNYSPTSGTYLNLNDGTFSWAGGKIKYDGNDLILNGVDLTWADIGDAPTKISQFENDSGYQNAIQVTQITKDTVTAPFIKTLQLSVGDEIVMGENATISWAKVSSKPTIPTKTSQLTNDSGYQNVAQVTQITKDTVTAPFIKALNLYVGDHIKMGENATISWSNVTNQPTIPSKTSQLTNDSQYATTSSIPTKVSQLTNDAGYAKTAAIPSKLSQLTNDSGYITASAVPSDDEIVDVILANRGTIITKDYIGTLKVVAGSVAAENITGTTITGKTVIVGGENNGNGSIIVKDANGATVCTIDENGISVKSKAFFMEGGVDIILGRYINWTYAPNLVQYADGFSNCIGTEDEDTVDGYVGGNGHNSEAGQKWGLNTGNINVSNYNTLKIGTYKYIWGNRPCGAHLYLYADNVLVKAYSGSDLTALIGSDNEGSAEFDISTYNTIRIEFIAESNDGDDCWVTVGLTSLNIS